MDSILGTPECIITEGEFDAAAVIAAGRKDVVSVPAGAQSNLTWLDRFVESHFEDKQAIYIAVDEDPAGSRSGRNSRAASEWNAAASCTSARAARMPTSIW